MTILKKCLLALLLQLVLSTRFPDPPVFTAVQSYPSICYLPPDSGLCSNDTSRKLNLRTRYYFDAVTQQCYPFGVQNCGGNKNRFKTREICTSYCSYEQ